MTWKYLIKWMLLVYFSAFVFVLLSNGVYQLIEYLNSFSNVNLSLEIFWFPIIIGFFIYLVFSPNYVVLVDEYLNKYQGFKNHAVIGFATACGTIYASLIAAAFGFLIIQISWLIPIVIFISVIILVVLIYFDILEIYAPKKITHHSETNLLQYILIWINHLNELPDLTNVKKLNKLELFLSALFLPWCTFHIVFGGAILAVYLGLTNILVGILVGNIVLNIILIMGGSHIVSLFKSKFFAIIVTLVLTVISILGIISLAYFVT